PRRWKRPSRFSTTSCCPPPRMRWSGATGAIARCKRVSTGCERKPRSAHAWRWTCGEKPKGQGATKPSTPYMRHGLPEATRYPCYSLEIRDYSIVTGFCMAPEGHLSYSALHMGVVKAPMCTTLPKRIYRTIMKPRINIITVGVDNLEKSLAFYREGLGLPSKGIVATEFHDEISGADGAIAIFELQNGLILSLYPRTELAK